MSVSLGMRIRELRQERGLTQEELGELHNIVRNVIQEKLDINTPEVM